MGCRERFVNCGEETGGNVMAGSVDAYSDAGARVGGRGAAILVSGRGEGGRSAIL